MPSPRLPLPPSSSPMARSYAGRRRPPPPGCLRTRTFTFAPLPFRCEGEGSRIGRESWDARARGWGGARRSAGSPAGAARAARWRRCTRCRPTTAIQPSPIRSATAPPSSSPTRGPPATTTMNTPCSRPRIRSGAADCRIVVRNTALTASDAPANAIANSAPHSAWVGVSHPPAPSRQTPRPMMPTAQPHDAHHDRQALATHRAEPAGGQGRQHRAHRRRGVEVARPCAPRPRG